jgi:exodeoxyribonuclease VII large subunit
MTMAAATPSPERTGKGLPRYSVGELNGAIGNLLERGFAPRFLVEGTVSRPQLKKGHLWLSLSDGEASINAVIWASQLRQLAFVPEEGDGVVVVGRLNFWSARATLTVQVMDLRPSLTAVLRQFERVHAVLEPEGLFDPARQRRLPQFPTRIALLTSVPSSALADMLRTAHERWPATGLLVVPIPVQGAVEATIREALDRLATRTSGLGIEALVLARGGGSREDLSVFDGEALARSLAAFPVPVVCGLGHEDDTTIADLVADYRAATPTAALVALLPDRRNVAQTLRQSRSHLQQLLSLKLQALFESLRRQRERLERLHPATWIAQQRLSLQHQRQLLAALSPDHLLRRGFALVRRKGGPVVHSIQEVVPLELLRIELADGTIEARIEGLEARGTPDAEASRAAGAP